MKLHIAVADDFESDCQRIEDCLARYFSEHQEREYSVSRFPSAEAFLKTYRKGAFQILFLDICMGEINGLELAELLRKADNEISIIFMSTTRDYVFQSFPFEPRGYLCKPYEYPAVAEVMERTLRKMFAKEKLIKITLPHHEIEISVNEIMAVLSNNHITELKMITDQTIQSNMLFSEIESKLENEPNFLVCNRGVIINMDYASQLNGDRLIMQNGSIYPVRRRGRKELSARFTKYIASRIRRKLDI